MSVVKTGAAVELGLDGATITLAAVFNTGFGVKGAVGIEEIVVVVVVDVPEDAVSEDDEFEFACTCACVNETSMSFVDDRLGTGVVAPDDNAEATAEEAEDETRESAADGAGAGGIFTSVILDCTI